MGPCNQMILVRPPLIEKTEQSTSGTNSSHSSGTGREEGANEGRLKPPRGPNTAGNVAVERTEKAEVTLTKTGSAVTRAFLGGELWGPRNDSRLDIAMDFHRGWTTNYLDYAEVGATGRDVAAVKYNLAVGRQKLDAITKTPKSVRRPAKTVGTYYRGHRNR